MNLYIDINKAVSQMPSTGQDAPDDDRAKAENSHSYGKDYSGSSNDSMNAGTVTKADSVLADSDEERADVGSYDENMVKKPSKKEKKVEKAFAVIPDEKVMEDFKDRNKEGVTKSFVITPAEALKDFADHNTEISKSATRMLNAVAVNSERILKSTRPNQAESEFLKSIGYTDSDITEGRARITGGNRSKFNRWLCNNLMQNIGSLNKSVGNL